MGQFHVPYLLLFVIRILGPKTSWVPWIDSNTLYYFLLNKPFSLGWYHPTAKSSVEEKLGYKYFLFIVSRGPEPPTAYNIHVIGNFLLLFLFLTFLQHSSKPLFCWCQHFVDVGVLLTLAFYWRFNVFVDVGILLTV